MGTRLFPLRTPGINPDAEDEELLKKRGPFGDIITRASQKYGVPEKVVHAIVKQESAGNPRARSPVGAQGLMQLMPETAKYLGVDDPNDPEQNIMGGTKYFRQMLDKFGGDTSKALAAYNAGPGNVMKYKGIPPFKETQNYVARILKNIGGSITPINPNDNIGSAEFTQPNSLSVPQTDSPISLNPETLKLFGMDPATQKREGFANKLNQILSGVAGATASINTPDYAEQIFKRADDRQEAYEDRKSKKAQELTNFLKLSKPNLPGSAEEYEYYLRQAKSQGQAPMSYGDWVSQAKRDPLARERFEADEKYRRDRMASDEQFRRDQMMGNNQFKQDALDLQKERLLVEKTDRADKAEKKKGEADKPLSAEAAKTLEIADGGLRNVDSLLKKVNSGSSFILPQVFDRELAFIKKDLSDRVGRLRSGGAMSKDEESNFLELLPGAFDSKKVKLEKLRNLQTMFDGIKTRMSPRQEKEAVDPQSVQQISEEDRQAIDWAKKNPNDPRSSKILQMHGGK